MRRLFVVTSNVINFIVEKCINMWYNNRYWISSVNIKQAKVKVPVQRRIIEYGGHIINGGYSVGRI